MPRLNPNLRPPGGFRFFDADKLEHNAVSYEKLVRAVTEYRERVGRPTGDPAAEITEQICGRSPNCCFFD